jgi:hypothetical protein
VAKFNKASCGKNFSNRFLRDFLQPLSELNELQSYSVFVEVKLLDFSQFQGNVFNNESNDKVILAELLPQQGNSTSETFMLSLENSSSICLQSLSSGMPS